MNYTIYCWGFDSCRDVTRIATPRWPGLSADGAYSAYNVTNITSLYRTLCNGESSCRNVDYLESYQITSCNGYKNCFNTTITTPSFIGDSFVYFYGFQSGAYSTLNFYRDVVINIRAASSLYNANINMYNSTKINAEASFGLNGAKLYCDSGQTCEINCFSYGCANISSATGEGNYSVDCRYNLISNILCSNTSRDIDYRLTFDINNDLPSDLIEEMINPDINFNDNVNDDELYLMYKNLSNPNDVLGINCGDYRQCYNDSMLNYINQAIVCSSYEACKNGSGLLKINDTYIAPGNNLVGIYCVGGGSCSNNQFEIKKPVGVDSNTFSIYCNGDSACTHATLTAGDNLYCGGYKSCQYSNIESMGVIFGPGMDTIGDIYCISYLACQYVTIDQTVGNIYGFGYKAMTGITIKNSVDNTIIEKIYAFGYHAAQGSKIENVKSIYASGYQVLGGFGSSITGIRNLYINDALSGNDITTQLTINDDSVNSTVILTSMIENHQKIQ